MQLNDFHQALFQANLLYDVELDEDDFEDIALIAWSKLGNKRVKLYNYRAEINSEDGSVDLPCNCWEVEAVTCDFEDWNYTTNYSNFGDFDTALIEQWIEWQKRSTDPLYTHGRFARFEQVGNKLYFKHKHGHVHILYKGIVSDENGLPQLTDKEVSAIAVYVAYVQFYKEGLKNRNPQTIQLSQDLERQWKIMCDAARVDEYINQNEMNEILDAKTSWSRKSYGSSFKPIIK